MFPLDFVRKGWRRSGLVLTLLMLLGLAACQTPSAPPAGPSAQPSPSVMQPPPLDSQRFDGRAMSLPHMAGVEPVGIALLLPLSAGEGVAPVADALYNAAQLALFDFNNPSILLMPKDTGGTADGAEFAAQEAIAEGAEIILGPLFAQEVAAVAPVAKARGIPVIAFSTDTRMAQDGIYLLSFLPEQDVDRIIDYAVQQNLTSFAALVPQSDYGRRVQTALARAVADRNATLYAVETYPPQPELMFEPAKRLAQHGARAIAEPATDGGDPVYAPLPYQAVLLPDGGTQLRAVAPLLPYFDVDPRHVQFLGTGTWDDANLGREPTLVGGWFPAPPPEAHDVFVGRYRQLYGSEPPRIASLAYDGMSLVAAFANLPAGQRFSPLLLTNPEGFTGVDGLFRLLPDGTNERGLAIMEMTPSGPRVLDPAPASFRPQAF